LPWRLETGMQNPITYDREVTAMRTCRATIATIHNNYQMNRQDGIRTKLMHTFKACTVDKVLTPRDPKSGVEITMQEIKGGGPSGCHHHNRYHLCTLMSGITPEIDRTNG